MIEVYEGERCCYLRYTSFENKSLQVFATYILAY